MKEINTIYTHIICNSAITSVPGHEHCYKLTDMVVRQVLPGKTWCQILSLVSVWSKPLYDMSGCPGLGWLGPKPSLIH